LKGRLYRQSSRGIPENDDFPAILSSWILGLFGLREAKPIQFAPGGGIDQHQINVMNAAEAADGRREGLGNLG
jgi:hypothetical protein